MNSIDKSAASLQSLDDHSLLTFPLHGPALIEASAGTGKTWCVTSLYLRHILAGRTVSEVLVVTYTNAATEELRGRIRQRLADALVCMDKPCQVADDFLINLLAKIDDEKERHLCRDRLRLALRSMDEAAIYTIHGFCQRMLSDFSFATGQQYDTEIIQDESTLRQQVVNDWWRQKTYGLDQADAYFFFQRLKSPQHMLKRIQGMNRADDVRILPETGTITVLQHERQQLQQDFRTLSSIWRKHGADISECLRGSAKLSRRKRRKKDGFYHPEALRPGLQRLDQWFIEGPVFPLPDDFILLTRRAIESHSLKRKPEDKLLGNEFFDQCDRWWRSCEDNNEALEIACLTDLVTYYHGQMQAIKKSRRLLSFDDLLRRLHIALESASGQALAEAIRQCFPVAIIDEFQDTDAVQYAIFSQLYVQFRQGTLVLIGDPKQAIYGFRGGDIFTYGRAKRAIPGDRRFTLIHNWRSTPELVNTVSEIFRSHPSAPFIFDQTIPFTDITVKKKNVAYLLRRGNPRPALSLWQFPLSSGKSENSVLSKSSARLLCHRAVTREIVHLLANARSGELMLGEQTLRAGDIAVLVRTNDEGEALQNLLAKHGVSAAIRGNSNVFCSDEAIALQDLLLAVYRYSERDHARRGLASGLLAYDEKTLAANILDEEKWLEWMRCLQGWHQHWRDHGFMAMFQRLLEETSIAQNMAGGANGERRLTNLLHLAELLQSQAAQTSGIDTLLIWLQRQLQSPDHEMAELRLHSEQELVQIVTVHGSKGLQYPVVFVPYLWSCRPALQDPPGFRQDGQYFLDFGSDQLSEHRLLADRDRLAEDLRLLYVALTRAQSKCYLIWGAAGKRSGHSGQTALAWLLHGKASADSLMQQHFELVLSPRDLVDDLQNLQRRCVDQLEWQFLHDTPLASLPSIDDSSAILQAATPARPLHSDWRISSFSALSQNIGHGTLPFDYGERGDDIALRFPAGSQTGNFLHALLERLSFAEHQDAQLQDWIRLLAPRFGIDVDEWGEATFRWIKRVLATALNRDQLCLQMLQDCQQFRELSFDFSVAGLATDELNRLLCQNAGRKLPELVVDSFRGMVNGIVDLIFEWREQYYIADYKSNFLGGDFRHYLPEKLHTAVLERRYDVQYLLYAIALHRYLGQRLTNYSYDRHFGGVYYLFLRGMRPETGPSHGVYFCRPKIEIVASLDKLFSGASG